MTSSDMRFHNSMVFHVKLEGAIPDPLAKPYTTKITTFGSTRTTVTFKIRGSEGSAKPRKSEIFVEVRKIFLNNVYLHFKAEYFFPFLDCQLHQVILVIILLFSDSWSISDAHQIDVHAFRILKFRRNERSKSRRSNQVHRIQDLLYDDVPDTVGGFLGTWRHNPPRMWCVKVYCQFPHRCGHEDVPNGITSTRY